MPGIAEEARTASQSGPVLSSVSVMDDRSAATA